MIVKPKIETYHMHSVAYVNLHIVIPCYIFCSISEKASLHFVKVTSIFAWTWIFTFFVNISKMLRYHVSCLQVFLPSISFFFKILLFFSCQTSIYIKKMKKHTNKKQFVAVLVLILQRFRFFVRNHKEERKLYGWRIRM